MSATDTKQIDAKQAENKFDAKPDVAAIEEKAYGMLAMNGGICDFSEGNNFGKLLPEGITVEGLLAGQAAVDTAILGIERAIGRASVEAMAANKELEQTSYKLPTFGKNYMEGVIKRSAVTRGAPGTNETKTVKGYFVVRKHEVVSTRKKSESENNKRYVTSLAEAAGL